VHDLEHRKALKDLGWLNCVGEDEAGKEVYAFFHPTFQEYFAACSIEHWDYFLPDKHVDQPVPCYGEDIPTYRVFEKEWRQVILLWIGRRDEVVTDKLKEKFIDKLTGFREEERKFYYYRAYCMAAICVCEFKSSHRAEEIVRQIVVWAFGYFNTDNQKWITYSDPVESLARETIPFTHREYAINILLVLLTKRNIEGINYSSIVEIIREIAVENKFAILYLTDVYHSLKWAATWDFLNNDFKNKIMFLLNDISGLREPSKKIENIDRQKSEAKKSNEVGVKYLQEVLCEKDLNCLNYVTHHNMFYNMQRITLHNERVINLLIEFVKNDNINYNYKACAVEALGRIATNNKESLFLLSNLLGNLDWDNNINLNRYYFSISEALASIDRGNSKVITLFVDLLNLRILNGCNKDLSIVSLGDFTLIEYFSKLLGDDIRRGQSNYIIRAIISLGNVAVNDSNAIEYFVKLIEYNNPGNYIQIIGEQITKIMTVSFMPLVIWRLKSHLENCKDEFFSPQCQVCHKILFHCAQTLTYSEFHTAWHQTHLPLSPQNLDNK
jgi:hypothetical protein